MLTGRTMTEVQTELNRQLKTKFDFLMPTSVLAFTVNGELTRKDKEKKLPLTDYAHGQMATYLKIPKEYYDRMRDSEPDLLAANVNRWIEKRPAERRMIRVLDGSCRAFLSDRYMPIDNHDVLKFLLPTIEDAGCQVVSAEITDRKMYIKALTPKITGEIKKGDKVQAGVLIQNSEIGAGRVQISPLVYRLVCSNGLIVNEMSARKNHVGRRATDDDLTDNGIYSRETIMMDVAAFLMKARDSVKAALTESVFGKIVNRMRDAADKKIEDVELACENVTNRWSLSDNEAQALMKRMINGADSSQYGLMNAVTAMAHMDVTDYDRSVELERIGGEILFG
jgi:hypothetical protein